MPDGPIHPPQLENISPLEVLQKFVAHVEADKSEEPWETALRNQVRDRLANNTGRGYLNALRNPLKASLSPKKRAVLAALIQLEADNFHTIVDRPGYNKALFFWLFYDLEEREDEIGTIAKRLIDTLSTDDVAKIFEDKKQRISAADFYYLVFNFGFNRKEFESEAYKQSLIWVKHQLLWYPYEDYERALRLRADKLEMLLRLTQNDPHYKIFLRSLIYSADYETTHAGKIDKNSSYQTLELNRGKVVNEAIHHCAFLKEEIEKERAEIKAEAEKAKQESEEKARVEKERAETEREAALMKQAQEDAIRLEKHNAEMTEAARKWIADLDRIEVIEPPLHDVLTSDVIIRHQQLSNENHWRIVQIDKEMYSLNAIRDAVWKITRANIDPSLKSALEEKWGEIKAKLEVALTEMREKKRQKLFIFLFERKNLAGVNERLRAVGAPFSNEVIAAAKKQFLLSVLVPTEESLVKDFPKIFGFDYSAEELLEGRDAHQGFLVELDAIVPGFRDTALRSFDLAKMILPLLSADLVESIKSNPILGQAFLQSPNYGFKLIEKFFQLDQLSRTNITRLLELKNEILADTPNLDVDSRDFRIRMQQGLAEYRNNPLIVEAMRRKGIDVEAWLNYEEEEYIELGESSATGHEKIADAVKRIEESIKLFIGAYKTTLAEWKTELEKTKVPAQNTAILIEELGKMKKRLASARSDQTEGIRKGIENTQSQIDNPRMVSVWSRIHGDLQRVAVLSKNILKLHENLKEKELELKKIPESTKSTREKRKEAQKLKQEVRQTSENIVQKTTKLQEQITQTKNALMGTLEAPLGKERAEALVQEIFEKINEPLDHTNTDINTITHALGEEISLSGSSLKVALWDRNPDVDLYLGNYTDCCIRIDSTHLGTECTIADYLTDLGVQVITITDEKTKMPVAAAWCWIGTTESDQIDFVVDNIEADTDYSTKYKEMLDETLRMYIEKYARAVGLKQVVQGPTYNDLDAAEIMEYKYYKVGGYNRPSGYYLEGEDVDENEDDPGGAPGLHLHL